MKQAVKNKLLSGVILGAVALLGIFVSLCGIGLSLGMRKLSFICFFSAVGLLAVLRLSVSLWNENNGMKSES